MSGTLPPVGATSGWSAAAPSQQQQELTAAQQQQELTAAVARLSDAIRELTRQQEQQRQSAELRNWLMVAATLMASVTYSAALNPPGGVWQADDAVNRYIAGKPVLRDKFPRQYNTFCTFNVMSFGLSLVIIVLSALPSYDKSDRKFLNYFVAFDMLFLGGAYVAGSWTTDPYNAVYYVAVFVLICVAYFLYDKLWEADQDN